MMGEILASCNLREAAVLHYEKGAQAGSAISMFKYSTSQLQVEGDPLVGVGKVILDDKTLTALSWMEQSVAALEQSTEPLSDDEETTLATARLYQALVLMDCPSVTEAKEIAYSDAHAVLTTLCTELTSGSRRCTTFLRPSSLYHLGIVSLLLNPEAIAEAITHLEEASLMGHPAATAKLEELRVSKVEEVPADIVVPERTHEVPPQATPTPAPVHVPEPSPVSVPVAEPVPVPVPVPEAPQKKPELVHTIQPKPVQPEVSRPAEKSYPVPPWKEPQGQAHSEMSLRMLKQDEAIEQLKRFVEQQQGEIEALKDRVMQLEGGTTKQQEQAGGFNRARLPPSAFVSADGSTVVGRKGTRPFNVMTNVQLTSETVCEWDIRVDAKEGACWNVVLGVMPRGTMSVEVKPGDVKTSWGVDINKKLICEVYDQKTHATSWMSGWIKNGATIRVKWDGPQSQLRFWRLSPREFGSKTEFGFHKLSLDPTMEWGPAVWIDSKISDVSATLKLLS
eukprot:TRINITY_DN656_c0_g1_i2.p1 TRINITY_DN656_c0_g1~~TRINITY_DN656_c0_g1_i2.p1  ORF type:complete len:507 (+),score=136.18 TRINITY_DN656_c0_g1_i2:196-1716(+)